MSFAVTQLDGLPAAPSNKPAQFDPAGASQIAYIATCARLDLVQAEREARMKWGRTVADARAHLRQASTVTVFVRTGGDRARCILLPVKTVQHALRLNPAGDPLPSELDPASGHMSIGTLAAIHQAEAAS